MGFYLTYVVVGILAGKFSTLSKPAFIVNFTLLQVCIHGPLCKPPLNVNGSQFFFNFGANSTTYVSLLRRIIRFTPTHNCYVRLQIYPAELFPTRYRAFAHGISAACGKFGAIISASAFSTLTNKIGTPAVLWSESLSSCQASPLLTYCMHSLLCMLSCRSRV